MTDSNEAWMSIDLDVEDPAERAAAGWQAIDLGAPSSILMSVVFPALVSHHDQIGAAAEEVADGIEARVSARRDLAAEAYGAMAGEECVSLLLPAVEAMLATDKDLDTLKLHVSVLREAAAPPAKLEEAWIALAEANPDGDHWREVAWVRLAAGDGEGALEALSRTQEPAQIDIEIRRAAATAMGDEDAESEIKQRIVAEHFDGDAGHAALALTDTHHGANRHLLATYWAQTMPCPGSDYTDEAIDDYLNLAHTYGLGDMAVVQMRATWGEEIPETARVMVARVFKQFDADYAGLALKQAYDIARNPSDLAVLSFDQAALAGDWEQAEELAQKNARMLLWIVPLSPSIEQWERCVAKFQELAYRDRQCVTAEFNIPIAKGDLEGARKLVDELDRFYADGDSAAERRALIDAFEGNLEMARANIAVALRKEPFCTFGLVTAAFIEALDGQWDKAVEYAQRGYAVREPFYVTDVDQLILEADRGGAMLEELIEWHKGVAHDAPYDEFYRVIRERAAERASA